jgi:hypothetical protein
MAKVSGVEIGLIVALSLVLAGGVILWIVWDKGLKDCEKGESPLCLTGSCPSLTKDTPTVQGCGQSPFKIDSSGKAVVQNGKLICKGSIVNYAGGPPTVQLN